MCLNSIIGGCLYSRNFAYTTSHEKLSHVLLVYVFYIDHFNEIYHTSERACKFEAKSVVPCKLRIGVQLWN